MERFLLDLTRVRRRLLVAALLSAASLVHAEGPARLRIGVEGAYPPFSEVAPDGSLKGFDIDIANALCAQMKVQCTLVQQDFDGMIPSLAARKFDAVVASMSITPERQKQVLFTDKYYQTPARLVARVGAGFEANAAGFKGKRIGVQRSTSHDRFASEQFAGAQVVRYGKQDEVFLDLAAGRIDATLADSVAIESGFLKSAQGKGFAFFGPVYNEPSYFGVGAGIALRKSDAALAARFNEAIRAIRADGTYARIAQRYFDFDVYGPAPAAAR